MRRAAVCLSTVGLLVALLLLTGCGGYSCPDPNGHCYAVASWTNRAYVGTFLFVQVVPLQGGNGFVDDETWLIDANNTGCANIQNMCWVEAGIIGLGTETHYFWADNRPNNGFFFHDIGQVPSGDFNHQALLYIVSQNSLPGFANTYAVEIVPVGPGGSGPYLATSTSNTMASQRIDLGQELDGSSGASAPDAVFSGMEYKLAGETFQDSLHTQDNDGSLILANPPPPRGRWVTPPSQSLTGGAFDTNCCS